MGRKSSKLLFKDAIVSEENGEFFIHTLDELGEKKTVNLSNEIRKFLNQEHMNFKLGKMGNSIERKQSYKYRCPSCAKEIKTTEENLIAKCMDCDSEFIKQD